MIYFIFGQSGSGKTTLAKAFKEYLHDRDNLQKTIIHLDGDIIRQMTGNYDYGKQGRSKNLELIIHMAKFFNESKLRTDVIVSVVCPFRVSYMFASRCGAELIYLYNTNSQKKDFHVDYFEVPDSSDAIFLDTTNKLIKESLEDLISHLEKKIKF